LSLNNRQTPLYLKRAAYLAAFFVLHFFHTRYYMRKIRHCELKRRQWNGVKQSLHINLTQRLLRRLKKPSRNDGGD